MAETVFDSYVKSVYGSGNGLNFFDSFNGGNEDLEIFGGVSPDEILDEIEGFYPKKVKTIEPCPEKPVEPCSEKPIDSESIIEDICINTQSDTKVPEESIIGYIQIGIHTTPIIEESANISIDDTVLAPIDIQLSIPKKIKTDAKSIGDTLKKIMSS